MKKKIFPVRVLVGLVCIMALVWGVGISHATEIGLAWVGKSGMAQRVTKGFEKGLSDVAPGISVAYHKELATLDELGELVDQFEKDMAGMVILRSNGAKWLGQNPPSIPTFIGACNNPLELGAIKNMDAPEGNITGVTYFLPVASQFETFQAILPDMKSVLLLYETGHPSAAIDREGTKAVCDSLGLEYREVGVKSKEAAIAAVNTQGGGVSLVIIGNQAVVIDSAKDIVAAAGDTPVLSFSSGPVKDGALGGFVAEDEKLGYMLAESVAEVLINGKAVRDVPVKVDPRPTFYVHAGTAQRLGIQIPYEVLQAAEIIE